MLTPFLARSVRRQFPTLSASTCRRKYASRAHHRAHIAQLLPVTDNDAAQARRELRWMAEELIRQRNLADAFTWDLQRVEDARLAEMVEERATGKPLQYILGNQPFGPLVMQLQPPILIPRPETEEWTGRLLSLLLKIQAPRDAPPLKLLDFCTGTGCIPLLLCSGLVPGRLMATGVDILPEAVDLARRNALANGITLASPSPAQMTSSPEGEEEKSGLSNTFKSLQIDLFSNDALETFVANPCTNPDVLTSNPPYIPLSDMQSLDRSVLEFESPLALTGDVLSSALSDSLYPPHLADLRGKGLDFYMRLSHLLGCGLVSSARTSVFAQANAPQVVFEIGIGQAPLVERILLEGSAKERLDRVERWTDFAGVERVVVGFLKEGS